MKFIAIALFVLNAHADQTLKAGDTIACNLTMWINDGQTTRFEPPANGCASTIVKEDRFCGLSGCGNFQFAEIVLENGVFKNEFNLFGGKIELRSTANRFLSVSEYESSALQLGLANLAMYFASHPITHEGRIVTGMQMRCEKVAAGEKACQR